MIFSKRSPGSASLTQATLAFIMSFMILIGGLLVDQYGGRTVYLWGVGILACSSYWIFHWLLIPNPWWTLVPYFVLSAIFCVFWRYQPFNQFISNPVFASKISTFLIYHDNRCYILVCMFCTSKKTEFK